MILVWEGGLSTTRIMTMPGATAAATRYEAAMALQLLSAPSGDAATRREPRVKNARKKFVLRDGIGSNAVRSAPRVKKARMFVLRGGIGGNIGIHALSTVVSWAPTERVSQDNDTPALTPSRRGTTSVRFNRSAGPRAVLSDGDSEPTPQTLRAQALSATSMAAARTPPLRMSRDEDASALPDARKRSRSHATPQDFSAGSMDVAARTSFLHCGPDCCPRACSWQSTGPNANDHLHPIGRGSRASVVLHPPREAVHHCHCHPAYASTAAAPAQACHVLRTTDAPSRSTDAHFRPRAQQSPPVVCAQPVLCLDHRWSLAPQFSPANGHAASPFAAPTASRPAARCVAHGAHCSSACHAGSGAAYSSASAAAAAAACAAAAAQAAATASLLEARAAWQSLLRSFPPNPERTDWLPQLELFHLVTSKGILPSTAHILRQSYAVCCTERGRWRGKGCCRAFLHTLRVTGLSFIASVDESIAHLRAEAQWEADERRRLRRHAVFQQPPPVQALHAFPPELGCVSACARPQLPPSCL